MIGEFPGLPVLEVVKIVKDNHGVAGAQRGKKIGEHIGPDVGPRLFEAVALVLRHEAGERMKDPGNVQPTAPVRVLR